MEIANSPMKPYESGYSTAANFVGSAKQVMMHCSSARNTR